MPEAYTDFESYMQLGVQQHMHQRYADALSLRFMAFESADNAIDSGRAARDIAASFDRLGNTDLEDERPEMANVSNQLLAEAYAEYAVREHEKFVPKISILSPDDAIDFYSLMYKDTELTDLTLTGSREFTVSAMYAAVLEARNKQGESALEYMSKSVGVSWALAHRYGKYHQYDVNLTGRAAGIIGMFADRPNGNGSERVKLAIKLAKKAETEQVLGHNESLTEQEVAQAQRKALIRAHAAGLILRLAKLPTRSLTRPIANKILTTVVL